MPTREELNKIARMVRGVRAERINKMTREEKYAELQEFFRIAQQGMGAALDVNELEKDRLMLGMTDEDLTQAIQIVQAVAGKIFNSLPMNADEFKKYVPESEWAKQRLAFWNQMRGIRRNSPYATEIGPEASHPDPPNWRKPDSKGSNLDRAVRVGEYLDKKPK